MAQVMEDRSSDVVAQPAYLPDEQRFGEFDYRPIPVLVPVSLFLSLLSISAIFWDLATVVPAITFGLALIAVWQIARADGALGGKWFARAGVFFSGAILVSALSLHSYNYATEVPEGYTRLSFLHDISNVAIETKEGIPMLTEDVKKLDGQKVFLKGYMYPTGQMEGIKQFVLCKDLDECCFGGTPKVTDMILVTLNDGPGVDYLERQLVSVAGTFRLQSGSVGLDAGQPVFVLEGDHFARSKTSY